MVNGPGICKFVCRTLSLSEVSKAVTSRTERIAHLSVLFIRRLLPNKVWAIMTRSDSGRSEDQIPERPRDFSFVKKSRPALGPLQPPDWWIPVDHSLTSNAVGT